MEMFVLNSSWGEHYFLAFGIEIFSPLLHVLRSAFVAKLGEVTGGWR
jgi:hypothetical protein